MKLKLAEQSAQDRFSKANEKSNDWKIEHDLLKARFEKHMEANKACEKSLHERIKDLEQNAELQK